MTSINFQPIFDYIDQTKSDLIYELGDQLTNIIRIETQELKNQIANLSGDVKSLRDEGHIPFDL